MFLMQINLAALTRKKFTYHDLDHRVDCRLYGDLIFVKALKIKLTKIMIKLERENND